MTGLPVRTRIFLQRCRASAFPTSFERRFAARVASFEFSPGATLSLIWSMACSGWNIAVWCARGGKVVLISDADGLAEAGEGCLATIEMPSVYSLIALLVYAVPV